MNERLLLALARLPDVESRPSQFHGEPAFWIDGREFVHTHGDDLLEIRLTRKLIAELDDERVMQRARSSDWIIVAQAEEEVALELAHRALRANSRA